MKTKLLFIPAILILLFTTSCNNCIKGSGKISTATSDLAEFNELEINVPANVQIRQSDKHSIEIQADENILRKIEYKVSGNTLKIELDKCITNFKVLDIIITAPEIEEIEINGSGKIFNSGIIKMKKLDININGSGNSNFNIETKELNVEINGAGNITVKGISDRQNIQINGAGEYSAFELITKKTDIDISGTGNCKVQVIDRLEVDISGSGNVYYKGDVGKTDININGMGKVVKQ